MLFQTFYDEFESDFGNQPKRFQDTQEGDGSTRLYQLSEDAICNHSTYIPEVRVNAILQTETTDYEIDYTLGTIRFTVAPGSGIVIKIDAWYQKVNLTDLIKYYNRASIKVAIQFPRVKTEEIVVADVSGATADDKVEELDMEAAPFDEWSEIKAVYQYKNDFRGVSFLKRERYLMFDCGSGNEDVVAASDYSYWCRGRDRTEWVGYLKYPYYLQGIKKYVVVDHEAVNPMATVIDIPDQARSQMLVQTALLMYTGMLHAMENENATSLRFSKMAEINKMIMSLSFALKDNRWNEAYGKGHTPDHKTRFINTNISD